MKYFRPSFVPLTVIIISSLLSFQQKNNANESFKDKWMAVDSLLQNGLPQSALKINTEILKEAKEQKEPGQYLKAVIYDIKIKADRGEADLPELIREVEEKLNGAEEPVKSTLHTMLGELYWKYFSMNRWRIYERSVSTADEEDMESWDRKKFLETTLYHYGKSIENKEYLLKTPSEKITEVLLKGKLPGRFQPSLFDLLMNRTLSFMNSSELSLDRPFEEFKIDNPEYYDNAETFIDLDPKTGDSLNLVYNTFKLYQDWLQARQNKTAAFNYIDLLRIEFIHSKSKIENDETRYLEALNRLYAETADNELKAEIKFRIASQYGQTANYYSPEDSLSHKYRWNFKKAHEIANEIIEEYPEANAAAKARNMLNRIERKSFSITAEKTYIPGQRAAFLLSYLNTLKLYQRLYRIDRNQYDELDTRFSNVRLEYLKKEAELVYETNWNLPDSGDYREHTTELLTNPLSAGRYVLVLSDNPEFRSTESIVSTSDFNVTNLSYVNRKIRDKIILFRVHDLKTGLPVEDVKVTFYSRQYRNSKSDRTLLYSQKTNDAGEVEFKHSNQRRYATYVVDFEKDDDYYSTNFNYYRPYSPENEAHTKVWFFTDRSLYRPGQTVYYKGIIINSGSDSSSLIKNGECYVELKDPSGKKIASQNHSSNEYGSFSGSFVLPSSGLNGACRLEANYNGSVNIQVEEYKRPKFEAEILPVDSVYRLGDSVKVSVKATTYAGVPVSGAPVKFSVNRRSFFWRSWMSEDNLVDFGQAETNEKGVAEFYFKTTNDTENENERFNYEISADITDINGETRSASETVVIGDKTMVIEIFANDKVEKTEDEGIKLNVQNLNGKDVKSEIAVEIWELKENELQRARLYPEPEIFYYSKDEWEKLYPGNEYQTLPASKRKTKKVFEENLQVNGLTELTQNWKSKLSQGEYLIVASTKDRFGKDIRSEQTITFYNKNNDKPATKDYDLYTAFDQTAEPGESASFLAGSAAKNVQLHYDLVRNNEVIFNDKVTLDGEQKLVKIPVKEEYRGGLTAYIYFIKHGRLFQHTMGIDVPYTNKQLEFEWETFRDELQPGDEEEWRVKIKDKKGDSIAAELLASMYDASLDQFMNHGWNFNFLRINFANIPWQSDQFNTQSGSGSNFYKTKRHEFVAWDYDDINWFGMRFGYSYLKSRSSSNIMIRGTSSLSGVQAQSVDEALSGRIAGVVADEEKSEFDETVIMEDRLEIVEEEIIPVMRREQPVQIRKNFNETAFFYPQLKTDENGEVIIAFTLPESLTRWKLMGLAHTEDLKFGQFEKEIIARKKLMITPNYPRFVREGDSLIISVKVDNLSDTVQNGNIELEVYNALNEQELVEYKLSKDFSTEVKGSDQASFSIPVGKNLSALKFRIVARSDEFSDGEEKTIPVLPNRILLTETMPLPIRKKGTKSWEFEGLKNSGQSKTLEHHKLTFEFTENPVWYALLSLPFMIEYPYECSEQIFSRYYAAALGEKMLKDNPAIKKVVELWKAAGDQSQFLSSLEKNPELKSIVLEETPWLLEANAETEMQQKFVQLMNENDLYYRQLEALNKLQEKQLPSGGYPWFGGSWANPYITRHIVAGFGKLKKIGVQLDNQRQAMINNAINFIDSEIYDDYTRLKQINDVDLNKDHINMAQVHYLYVRSFFPDIEIDSKYKVAFDYFLGQAEKYWQNKSRYFQGMAAISLYRNQKSDIAQKIIRSLKEYALESEEFGIYWKSLSPGYFWQDAPIETHSLLMEAFKEVDGDKALLDEMKVWLIKQKQTQAWPSTKSTTDAIYALLYTGSQIKPTQNKTQVELGDSLLQPKSVMTATGYFKTSIEGENIKPEMGDIKITKQEDGVSWGAVYWQYFEDLDKINEAETGIQIEKELLKETYGPNGRELKKADNFEIGDRLIVRLVIKSDRSLEFVHIKDMRAAGLEPEQVLSGYRFQQGTGYYEVTKDASTNFFFDRLNEGTYVFEYPLLANNAGVFSNGISTVQCMYAPEFSAHSKGAIIKIVKSK